jgi:hypothetical protein
MLFLLWDCSQHVQAATLNVLNNSINETGGKCRDQRAASCGGSGTSEIAGMKGGWEGRTKAFGLQPSAFSRIR